MARDNLDREDEREGGCNREQAEAQVIAEPKIPPRIGRLHRPEVKPANTNTGAVIARASANWPTMSVLQSFARTTSIPHWQNAYSPLPIRVQEKFWVSDSGLLMLMFDKSLRLTGRAGIPALTLIGLNLPSRSQHGHGLRQ